MALFLAVTIKYLTPPRASTFAAVFFRNLTLRYVTLRYADTTKHQHHKSHQLINVAVVRQHQEAHERNSDVYVEIENPRVPLNPVERRYASPIHLIFKTMGIGQLLPTAASRHGHGYWTCKSAAMCVCVFSHSFWTSSSVDVPAGVTQEEGYTRVFIHLPCAVRALVFLARRIQPFPSLVDREVEFCVITI